LAETGQRSTSLDPLRELGTWR